VYRRQRDGFYTLLEYWDSERQFTKGLTKETLAIFEHFPMEPENLAYFCRLFVSQLICSCIGDGPNGVNKTPLNLQVDPERLKKLHERLVTPAKTLSGPCPPPEFSGWEEFFRDFIVIAANMKFNQHLLDALASKLYELESQHFSHDELQPKGFFNQMHFKMSC
jgi:codanin-1